ncbi:glycosyltransferase family 2 protein [Rhodococcus sp. WS4]|nr:glycosyltransferase family 2 protein [Rhodococcus sp. WS4]
MDENHGLAAVSVVIPVLNCRDLLDVQLEALSKQTYAGGFEVIISDNGSTDGLEGHLQDHPLRDELKIMYVDSSDRRGAAHARNVGVDNATGEFIAFCDADDRVHKGWLTALVQFAADYDVVGGAVETVSLNTPEVQSWSPMPAPEEQGQGFLPHAAGANMGCWAKVYSELHGMNEDFANAQDVEFLWRAQLSGYRFGFLKTALVAYRLRENKDALRRRDKALGYSFAQLAGAFREAGHPPIRFFPLVKEILLLALVNPVLTEKVTKVPEVVRSRYLAFNIGALRGGIKFQSLKFV